MKRHNAVVDLRRDWLQLRQCLNAALHLSRLARLRLEAVDESLQLRVRRVFRFGEKTCAFCVRRQHTQSIKLSSPPGTSCATWPMRALRGIEMAPSSGETSPFNRLSSVVLPAPLRPTRPTLWPEGIAAVARSRIGLPSIL